MILIHFYAMHLKCVSSYNTIVKYADDTILLVPQNSPVSLEDEFGHIIDWSFNNKLTVNISKTKEIVFRRSLFPNKLLPPLLPDIQRVDSVKLLGVYLSRTLYPDQHINHLLSQCNQRLYYLLSQLKSENRSAQCLDIFFQALILSKITFAIPAFAGLISVTFRSKINKFFHKAHRHGLVTTLFDIQGLIDKHDTHLFRSIAYTDHCIHYLLPQKLNRSMNLRHRPQRTRIHT